MKPLGNIRVLDFTQVLAGPLAAQYLGDLGADVIKIERPDGGDDTRGLPPFREGLGAMFLSVNRNKRSLAVDLKTPAGRDIVHRLVKSADVVLEAFSEAVPEKLGIDYATLSAINPSLVYCSISGFGRSGPLSGLRGYDLVLQSFSGIMDLTGHPGGPATRVPLSPVDQTTGLHAFSGILAALLERSQTGKGCFLEVSLFETAVALLGFNLDRYWARGTMPPKSGSGHESLVPYDVFEAQDGPLLLGIANDNLWRRFCQLVERPEMADDERFATSAARVRNRDAVMELVRTLIATRPRQAWLELLAGAGVPASPLNTMKDVLEHPHTKARGIIMDYEHPSAETLQSVAYPVVFNDAPRQVRLPPPRLGEHTRAILGELGFKDDETEALDRNGEVRIFREGS